MNQEPMLPNTTADKPTGMEPMLTGNRRTRIGNMVSVRDIRHPKYGSDGHDLNADIIPKVSIRIFGVFYGTPFDQTFRIGDQAEYDSYNLIFYGPVLSITDRTVTVATTGCGNFRNRRFRLFEFACKNANFNLDKIIEHNRIESQCI